MGNVDITKPQQKIEVRITVEDDEGGCLHKSFLAFLLLFICSSYRILTTLRGYIILLLIFSSFKAILSIREREGIEQQNIISPERKKLNISVLSL